MARILFVDDDPYTLAILKKAAEIYGHQAILANTGQEALQIASEQSPQMIFIDMKLADMDGLVLVRRLSSDPVTSATPIVVLSAGQELDVAAQAQEAGASAYLHKPVRLQTLHNIICQYTSPEPQPPES